MTIAEAIEEIVEPEVVEPIKVEPKPYKKE